MGDLEWNEMTAHIEEGEVVAMFGVLIKGEPGVRISENSQNTLGLIDIRLSITSPYVGINSLLDMVSLEYVGRETVHPTISHRG